MKIDEREIRVDSFLNGPGVNVKLIHLPTGIATKSHYHRSGVKAKKAAMKELETSLKEWVKVVDGWAKKNDVKSEIKN